MTTQQDELPLFFGQRVTKTALSVSGTIESVDGQPPELYTDGGTEVYFIGRATVAGGSWKRDELGVVWKNKWEVVEAFQLDDEIGLKVIDEKRQEVAAIIDARFGRLPVG